jgi:TatD DNase family protein
VLKRARAGGVGRILVPGLTLASSKAILELTASDPLLFAAVGIHPTDALTWNEQSLSGLEELGQNPKVVAIGEIGLDYYWDTAPHALQRDALKEQLSLAAELGLPVILHMREKGDAPEGDCSRDLLSILSDWVTALKAQSNPLAERPGVLHSFSGSLQTAREAITLNFFIGVSGPITYKNADSRREIIRALPLERLLLETDAPFLAPVPQRGKRNEPAYMRHIADKIAEIHSISPEKVAEFTTRNAARLFRWEVNF